ncbi:MAG TPA: PAS domain S-box protein, partial [Anaeromyxobacter sp.]
MRGAPRRIRWIEAVVAESAREGAKRLFADVLEGRTSSFQHETAIARRGGELRLVRWTTTLLRDGHALLGIACLGEDVTERRHAEQEHRIARAALDSSGTAIAIGDAEARLLYVNDAFLRLWRYERAEQVIGRSALEFWSDEAAARAVVDGLMNEGRWIGELAARRADGRAATHAVQANLFSDPETGTVRMIATFEDVTELRSAEERLVEAQRLARVGYWSLDLATFALTWG